MRNSFVCSLFLCSALMLTRTYCQNTSSSVQIDDNELGMGILFDMVNIFTGDVLQKKRISESFLNLSTLFQDGKFQSEQVNNWQDWAEYLIGFAVCAAIGIVFIVVMPIAGFIFCCCRLCGRCGAKSEKSSSKRSKCKRRCYCTVLIILTTVTLVGSICAFICNSIVYKNLQNDNNEGAFGHVNQSLNNIETFINDSVNVYASYVNDVYQKTSREILTKVNDSASAAVDAVIKQLNADTLLASATNISKVANETKQRLDTVSTLLSELSNATTELKDNLTDIGNILKSACNNSTVNHQCSGVDLTQYNTDTDFSRLDQLSNESGNVAKALNMYGYIVQANQSLESAKKKAHDSVSDKIGETEKAVQDIQVQIDKGIQDLQKKSDDLLSVFPNTYDKVTTASDDVKEYSKYIFYGGIGVCCVYLLVVVLYYIGLLFGLCGEKPGDGAPCCNTGCGARFLLSGVAFTFIFSWILMIICVILFCVGGPVYTEACRYFQGHDPDQFKAFDGLINEAMDLKSYYTDVPPDVSISRILQNCQENKALFSALQLDYIIDLNKTLDISQLQTKLDDLTNANLQLDNITIINDDLKNAFTNFSHSGIEKVDFTKYYTELSKKLTIGNLSQMASIVDDLAANENDAQLQRVFRENAKRLQDLHDIAIKDIENKVFVRIMDTTIPYHAGMLLGRSVNMKTIQPGFMLVEDDVLPTEQKVNQTTSQFSFVTTLKDVCNILSIPPEYALKVKADIKDAQNELVQECLKDLGKEDRFKLIFRVTYIKEKQYISPADVPVSSEVLADQVKSTENKHTTESLSAEAAAVFELSKRDEDSSLPGSLTGKSQGHPGTHWVKAIEVGNELVTVLTVSCKDSAKLDKLRIMFSKCLQADSGQLEKTMLEALVGCKIDKKLTKTKDADVCLDIQYASFTELDKYPASMKGMVKTIYNFMDECVGWTVRSEHDQEFKVDARIIRCKPGIDKEEKTPAKDSAKHNISKSPASSNRETCEKDTDQDSDDDCESFVVLDSAQYFYNMRITLQPFKKNKETCSSLAVSQSSQTTYSIFEKLFKQLVNSLEAMQIIMDFVSNKNCFLDIHVDEANKVNNSIQNSHLHLLVIVEDLDFVCIPTENSLEYVITKNPLTTVNDFIEFVRIMDTTIPYHAGMLLGRSVNMKTIQLGSVFVKDYVLHTEQKVHQTKSWFSFATTLRDVCDVLNIPPVYALKIKASIEDVRNELVEECLKDLGEKDTFKIIFRVTYIEQKQYISPAVVPDSSEVLADQVKSTENEHTTESLSAEAAAVSESSTRDEDSSLPGIRTGKSQGHPATHWVKAKEVGNELVTVLSFSCQDSEKLDKLKRKLSECLQAHSGRLDKNMLEALIECKIDKKLSKTEYADVRLDIQYASFTELDTYPASIKGMVKIINYFMDQCFEWARSSKESQKCEVEACVMRCRPGIDKKEKTPVKKSVKSKSYFYNMRIKLQPFKKNKDSCSSLAMSQSPETTYTILERLFKQLVNCLEAHPTIEKFVSSKYCFLDIHVKESKRVIESINTSHRLVLETVADLDFVCIPTENTLENVITQNPLTTVNDFIENVTSKLPPGSDIDLLMIGKTGHGKSATGNSILGRDNFLSSANGSSVTSQSGVGWVEIDSRIIKVVDTPGVCSTNLDDEASTDLAINSISKAIAYCPEGFHALLLFIRFGTRMTAEERTATMLLKNILGEDIIKSHCIFVMTHGDNFETEMEGTKITFEDWCKNQKGDLKKLFEECNYRCVLFNNKAKDPKVKKAQLIKLVAQVDSLKDSGRRYTNDLFEFVQKERRRTAEEENTHRVNEEILKEMQLILQSLDSIISSDGEDEEYSHELSSLKKRSANLESKVIATKHAKSDTLLASISSLLEKIIVKMDQVTKLPKPAKPSTSVSATPSTSVSATPSTSVSATPSISVSTTQTGAIAERWENSVQNQDLVAERDKFQEQHDELMAEHHENTNKVAHKLENEIKTKRGCFPGSSVVMLSNKKSVCLEELCVGDEVLVRDRTGCLRFDTVYMFGHQELEASSEFLALKTASQTVYVTSGHYVYCIKNGTELCVSAENVHVRDCLLVATKDGFVPQPVQAVTYERKRGLFAPFTNSGNIVIDGALMSCYIDVLPATTCHTLLWPVRQLYRVSPRFLSYINGPSSKHPIPRWAKAAMKLM